jgi:hypothetical protein
MRRARRGTETSAKPKPAKLMVKPLRERIRPVEISASMGGRRV